MHSAQYSWPLPYSAPPAAYTLLPPDVNSNDIFLTDTPTQSVSRAEAKPIEHSKL